MPATLRVKKAPSTDEAEKNEPDLDIPAEIERHQTRLTESGRFRLAAISRSMVNPKLRASQLPVRMTASEKFS